MPILRVPLESGEEILLEIESTGRSDDIVRARSGGETVVEAEKTFTEALRTALPAAEALVERIQQLGRRPDALEIEFGVRLTAEAGAIIAKAGGEARFAVTLKWG